MGITPNPSICKLPEGSPHHPITTEMIASKMLMLCLVALTIINLSNGEQSKEDCYKPCTEFCNQEKDRVKAAFDEFTRTLRDTIIFKNVLGTTLPTTWEPIGKDACYDNCKENSSCY